MPLDDQQAVDRSADLSQTMGSPADAASTAEMGSDAALESFCRDLIHQEDFSAARVAAADLRAARSAALGSDHPATIRAAGLLGAALNGLGETAEVRQLAEEMLERCRRQFGADDQRALKWQKILADTLRALSEARPSVQLAEDLLARRRRILGGDDEDTLAAAASLAAAMTADNDYEAARSMAEDVWERRVRTQGPDHPDTLDAAYFLSFVTSLSLAGLEKRQQAGRLALDTLAQRERTLGYFHPRTVASRKLVTNMRGFPATFDPAGAAYARIAGADLSEAAGDCVPFTLGSFIRDSGMEPTTLRDPAVVADVVREANERIIHEVRRLVGRNDRLTVLVCARRVPRQWIRRFLEQALDHSLDDLTMRHVEGEFPLLAANIALDCPPTPTGRRPPRTSATLLDGVRIALLCALHRMHAFNLNSAVRLQVFGPPQGFGSPWESSLIDSYVRRCARASDVKSDVLAYARDTSAEGITGLTSRLTIGETAITLTASKELGEQPLVLANFLPITISSERDRRWFGYLHHPNAAPHLGGLPFERWWSCWLSLNAVAAWWVRDNNPPSSTDVSTAAERERLRLCCEAHNLGMIEVDRDRLRDAVLSTRIPGPPSPAEYDAFVSSLTWRLGAQKPEFIESPAVFYPSGEETMFWDLLRHGGVLPGLARRAARKRGGLGEHIGKHFEGRVHAALKGHPAVTHLRSDVLVGAEAGSDGLQIDHGFVVSGLLVLVESKSHAKTPGYFVADDVGFRKRAKRVVENVLPGRDEKLRALPDQIVRKWEPAAPQHALYVVCTSEVEYIPSEDPAFWLDRDRDISRVCTLDELLDWLNHVDPAAMATHPRCISLRRS